jgi:hypothetical protein
MNRVVLHVTWVIFAVCAGETHVSIVGSANEATLMLVAGLIGLQSIFGFVTQGGNLITGSSVVSYGILLFAVFPAYYIALGFWPYSHKTDMRALVITVILVGVLQSIILAVCPSRKVEVFVTKADHSGASWAGSLALLLFALTISLNIEGLELLQSASGIISILFAAIAVIDSPSVSRSFLPFVLLMATFTYYNLYVFHGFGRLVIGMIGFGILMIISLRFPGRLLKIGVLLLTAPIIVVFSYQRVEFLTEIRGSSTTFDEGIGSVVGPLSSAATIVGRMWEGSLEPALGATLLAALVVWVPSNLWHDKPLGFGSEIVPVTQPHLSHVENYSDAALIVGEGVWNFGVFGSVLMFTLLAVWVRFLDRWLVSSYRRFGANLNRSLAPELVLVVLLSSGLLNIIWGSWHAYTARLFVPTAILLCVWLAMKACSKDETSQDGTQRTLRSLGRKRERLKL